MARFAGVGLGPLPRFLGLIFLSGALAGPVRGLLPVYADSTLHQPPAFSSLLLSLLLVGGGLFALVGGALADRLGSKRTLLVGLTWLFPGALLFRLEQPGLILATALVAGLIDGLYVVGGQSYLVGAAPKAHLGLGSALFFLGSTLGHLARQPGRRLGRRALGLRQLRPGPAGRDRAVDPARRRAPTHADPRAGSRARTVGRRRAAPDLPGAAVQPPLPPRRGGPALPDPVLGRRDDPAAAAALPALRHGRRRLALLDDQPLPGGRLPAPDRAPGRPSRPRPSGARPTLCCPSRPRPRRCPQLPGPLRGRRFSTASPGRSRSPFRRSCASWRLRPSAGAPSACCTSSG